MIFNLNLQNGAHEQEDIQELIQTPDPGQLSFQIFDAPLSGNSDSSVGNS
jgi:hypothetical protein